MASFQVIPQRFLFQEALVNPHRFLFQEALGNVYVYVRLRVLVRLWGRLVSYTVVSEFMARVYVNVHQDFMYSRTDQPFLLLLHRPTLLFTLTHPSLSSASCLRSGAFVNVIGNREDGVELARF
jgi:hypothetical protein